jgi:hypothetical protein
LIPSEEASNEFVVALECRENDALWRGSETWRTLLKNLVSFFEGAITATFARALDQLPSMQSSKNQSEPHSSSSSSPQIRRERGVTSPRLVDVKSSKQKETYKRSLSRSRNRRAFLCLLFSENSRSNRSTDNNGQQQLSKHYTALDKKRLETTSSSAYPDLSLTIESKEAQASVYNTSDSRKTRTKN